MGRQRFKGLDISLALARDKMAENPLSIYRVDIKPRVVEASTPYEAALKAGCLPSACTVTDITRDIIDLEETGDIEVLKGEEIKP